MTGDRAGDTGRPKLATVSHLQPRPLPVVTVAATVDLRSAPFDRQVHALFAAGVTDLPAGAQLRVVGGEQLPEQRALDLLGEIGAQLGLTIHLEVDVAVTSWWVDGVRRAIGHHLARSRA